jgi:CheY-like chemotaxis protein
MSDTTLKVLHIDDDPAIRDIVRMIFLRAGERYALETAENGREGIAKAGSFRPGLILLDRQMPGMDGAAVLQALQENSATERIPVIFLTGENQEDAPLPPGVIGMISKPFRPKEFTAACERLLENCKNH